MAKRSIRNRWEVEDAKGYFIQTVSEESADGWSSKHFSVVFRGDEMVHVTDQFSTINISEGQALTWIAKNYIEVA